MATITETDTIKTITKHYIDGEFVESHGREVMDIIKPTNGKVIAHVTLLLRGLAEADKSPLGRGDGAPRIFLVGRARELPAPAA
jgi:hypothetical protein